MLSKPTIFPTYHHFAGMSGKNVSYHIIHTVYMEKKKRPSIRIFLLLLLEWMIFEQTGKTMILKGTE